VLLKTVAYSRAVAIPVIRGSGTDLVLNRSQLSRSPAGGSLPNLLVQLPGAARGANGVVHINGDHGDVNYIVDGVPIPTALDRQIGTQLDPSDISFFEAIEGAYPAQYGDHFAATINIDTKTGVAGPPGFSGYVQAGSYGHIDQGLTYQAPAGKGSLVVGVRDERSDWMLDPPGYQNIHNQGSNADQYMRYTLPLNSRDYLDFSATHSLRWYQISPDIASGAPAMTDDNEEQDESFVSVQMHHTLRTDGALTYGVAFNSSKIIDSNDPSNDFLYGENGNLAAGGASTDCSGLATLTPSPNNTLNGVCGFSVYANRLARDGIFNIDNVVRSAHHEVRWGAIEDVTNVQKDYQISLQPNSYLDPAAAPPIPTTGYTCQGPSGVCTVTDNQPNTGHNTQAYLQDSWRMGNTWELDYGLRYDNLNLNSAQFSAGYSQFSPRIKLTRYFGTRASVYAYFGRFFTPFALENVDPSAAYILNYPAQRSVASFDLQPQRDSDYELGAHLPVGRGQLGLRVMQKNATNWIDDTEVGQTALFQNVNYAEGRVAVQGATYLYPLAHGGSWMTSVVHTYAVDKGCETQLLAACQGGNYVTDWTPADHDQRWDITSGVTLPDTRGGWFGLNGEYGSGLSTALPCNILACKVPPHMIFNIEKGFALGNGRDALYVKVLNLLNDHYYVTYLNAQGNHVGMPRDFEFGYRFGGHP